MRQWVLSVPKRLRYFMQRDAVALNMVLRMFLRGIAQSLQSHCPVAAQVDKAALHTRPVESTRLSWPRCRPICADASCAPSWAEA